MYTVGIRVLTRQIRVFSTFSVSSALRHCPSARCTFAANYMCRSLDNFKKNNRSGAGFKGVRLGRSPRGLHKIQVFLSAKSVLVIIAGNRSRDR
jgi:hypothetical protein